jgi:hypothetical protein
VVVAQQHLQVPLGLEVLVVEAVKMPLLVVLECPVKVTLVAGETKLVLITHLAVVGALGLLV